MNDLFHIVIQFIKYSLHYASYYLPISICRKIDGSIRLNIFYIGGWQPVPDSQIGKHPLITFTCNCAGILKTSKPLMSRDSTAVMP